MRRTHDQARVAIIGCGAAALECHVPGLARTPVATLVAAVDPQRLNAERLAEAYALHCRDAVDVLVTDDPRALEGMVDAAIVATPHRHHASVVAGLLDVGIPCLVEKPFTLTIEECDGLVGRRGNLILAVAHVRRLFPAGQWVRGLLRDSAVGLVQSVRWAEGMPYDWPLVSPSLFDTAASGGGVLADTGPHVIDMVQWWLGGDSPEIVSCADTSRGGAESEVEVHLRCGATEVELAFSRLRQLTNTCSIIGSEASLEVGIDQEAPYALRSPRGELLDAGTVPSIPPAQEGWEDLFAEQLRNFVAAVRGEEDVYADWRDGRRVVDTIERCYASATHVVPIWSDLVGS